MRISDWSSDVCSSDLPGTAAARLAALRVAVLDFDAVGELRVEPAVVLDQRRLRRARQDAHHLCDGVCRQLREIGRASCRERVCKYGLVSGVAVLLKKQNKRLRCDIDHLSTNHTVADFPETTRRKYL